MKMALFDGGDPRQRAHGWNSLPSLQTAGQLLLDDAARAGLFSVWEGNCSITHGGCGYNVGLFYLALWPELLEMT